MIVYHGSNVAVQYPDVAHTLRNLDFGKGFYVTTVREQAERWAKRKTDFVGGEPVLNFYEMDEDLCDVIVQDFGENLDSWLEFVCGCRDGGEEYLQYDIIKGKVADDKVFRVVDMYHQGIWDKERALREIRVYPTYDQISFVTQNAIAGHLRFVQSEVVKR